MRPTTAQIEEIYRRGEAMASILEKAHLGRETREKARATISEFRRSVIALGNGRKPISQQHPQPNNPKKRADKDATLKAQ